VIARDGAEHGQVLGISVYPYIRGSDTHAEMAEVALRERKRPPTRKEPSHAGVQSTRPSPRLVVVKARPNRTALPVHVTVHIPSLLGSAQPRLDRNAVRLNYFSRRLIRPPRTCVKHKKK